MYICFFSFQFTWIRRASVILWFIMTTCQRETCTWSSRTIGMARLPGPPGLQSAQSPSTIRSVHTSIDPAQLRTENIPPNQIHPTPARHLPFSLRVCFLARRCLENPHGLLAKANCSCLTTVLYLEFRKCGPIGPWHPEIWANNKKCKPTEFIAGVARIYTPILQLSCYSLNNL